jgi:hypothetical protein
LKFGYEYQAINTDIEDFHPKYGQDSYAGQFSRQALGTAVVPAGLSTATAYNLADFFYGARSQYQLTNTTILRYRQRMNFGFVQDDFKVSPKLTLNLGVRYEFATPQWEADGHLANFDPATKTLIQGKGSGSLYERALVNPDRNNWAPRVGLAYSLTPKTAIRAGYGVSYIHFNRLGGENILGYNPPTVNTVQVDQLVTQGLCGASSNPLTCFTPTQQGYPANLTVPANVSFLLTRVNYTPPDTRTGYVQAWHFTVQRELFSNFVLGRGLRRQSQREADCLDGSEFCPHEREFSGEHTPQLTPTAAGLLNHPGVFQRRLGQLPCPSGKTGATLLGGTLFPGDLYVVQGDGQYFRAPGSH